MIELEKIINKEYERVLADFPDDDIDSQHIVLNAKEVLRAHFLIANHFYLQGHGLGGIGPRDTQLLLSAVDRQVVSFDGKLKWSECFDIAATLFFGLIKNHAFHDANKRTAFLSVLFLLYKYQLYPSVPKKQFENFTVEVADNLLSRYDRYKALKKKDLMTQRLNLSRGF